MKLLIDVPDEALAALLEQARKEGVALESVIASRLQDPATALQDLDDDSIDALAAQLHSFALSRFDASDAAFTLMQLVVKCCGPNVWGSYSGSTRKKLGRRFKALVAQHPSDGGKAVVACGTTITSAALYCMS